MRNKQQRGEANGRAEDAPIVLLCRGTLPRGADPKTWQELACAVYQALLDGREADGMLFYSQRRVFAANAGAEGPPVQTGENSAQFDAAMDAEDVTDGGLAAWAMIHGHDVDRVAEMVTAAGPYRPLC